MDPQWRVELAFLVGFMLIGLMCLGLVALHTLAGPVGCR